jgi:amino-acid N-acetyltransferase
LSHLPTPRLSGATADDLPAVLALLRRCKLLETGVTEAIADFYVARSGEALVGCAGLEAYGKFGLLRSVAVESAARGAGLGARLVKSVVAAARARGQCELFLLTTTAAPFFERHGFVSVLRSSAPAEVAGSWEFRVGCPETALTMRLSLAGP